MWNRRKNNDGEPTYLTVRKVRWLEPGVGRPKQDSAVLSPQRPHSPSSSAIRSTHSSDRVEQPSPSADISLYCPVARCSRRKVYSTHPTTRLEQTTHPEAKHLDLVVRPATNASPRNSVVIEPGQNVHDARSGGWTVYTLVSRADRSRQWLMNHLSMKKTR